MKFFKQALIVGGAVSSAAWGGTLLVGALASAPVTAPIAAASGAILAGSVMLGFKAKD